MARGPPRAALVPYTALFRSLRADRGRGGGGVIEEVGVGGRRGDRRRVGDRGAVGGGSAEHASEVEPRGRPACRRRRGTAHGAGGTHGWRRAGPARRVRLRLG